MKTIGLVPDSSDLLENKIFGPPYNVPFAFLKSELRKRNILINTIDKVININKLDALIYFNVTALRPYYFSTERIGQLELFEGIRIAVLYECEAVIPNNFDLNLLSKFDYVFTWNDKLVDNKKYLKFNFPQHMPKKYLNHKIPKKRKFLTLINANKLSYHPDELYSFRRKTIHYFEHNAINNFDLYGKRWNVKVRPTFKNVVISLLKYKNLKALHNYFNPDTKFPSYKGEIINKFKTLDKYKFALCFENMMNVQGYITEKIWDCFKVRVVPVYLGANNILDFIPQECFIDMRNFNNFDELHHYLSTMRDDDYFAYTKAIDKFVHESSESNWFDKSWGRKMAKLIARCMKYE